MIKFLLINLIFFSAFGEGMDYLLINKWIDTLDSFKRFTNSSPCLEINSSAPLMSSETKELIQAIKPKTVLQKCLSSKRKIQKKHVSYNSFHHCSGNLMMSDKVNYDISIEKGKPDFFKIGLNILLKTSEPHEVLERTESARKCVQQVYANQGLYLDLNFYMVEEVVKDKTTHWSVKLTPWGEITDEKLCVTIAHELAHTLGLGDTYHDPRCTLRTLSKNPKALMNVLGDPREVALEEREVATIIEPLCGTL